jgi:phenylalanine-4-hydroxylase
MSVAVTDRAIEAGSKNRYRNAPRNADYTIDQDWPSYSAAEHDRWDRLFKRSQAVLHERACDEFIAMMHMLKLSESGIRHGTVERSAR